MKQVRQEAETARISLRNARRDAVKVLQEGPEEGMPEDEAKDGETQAQKMTEKFSAHRRIARSEGEGDHDGVNAAYGLAAGPNPLPAGLRCPVCHATLGLRLCAFVREKPVAGDADG